MKKNINTLVITIISFLLSIGNVNAQVSLFGNDELEENPGGWDFSGPGLSVKTNHEHGRTKFSADLSSSFSFGFISGVNQDEGVSIEEIYENVMSLFPSMRKIEKRQVRDYISGDNSEEKFEYGRRTHYGNYYYTDERLKLQYPRSEAREKVIEAFSNLYTPNGRRGLNLAEGPISDISCDLCPHISYCKIAKYAVDKEDLYD